MRLLAAVETHFWRHLKVAALIWVSLAAGGLARAQFFLHVSPSDGELSNIISGYVASYTAANNVTNAVIPWTEFSVWPAGVTNVQIPSRVPSPSFVLVKAIGTNGVRSLNTNYVLYSTNDLWASVSNRFMPPPPGSIVITNY